jgi:hypothetical protein
MKPWLKQPGECHDSKGIPIYPGDLLRSFHFRGQRRRIFYLYHVAIFDSEAGGMRMMPASYLEPTIPRTGGDPLLSDDLALATEVVHGPIVGDAILFTERPRKSHD